MSYISISLYRKVIQHAIHEGMSPADFSNPPTQIEIMDSLQAVPKAHDVRIR
ncbi:MAG: hypothetical protein RIF33_16025 [Cyclobacteriaceae bacterium]